MSLLSELSKASELNSIELVCQLIGEVLSKYANDTPFSMLYLLDDAQNLVLRSCTGLLPNSSLSLSIITPMQRGAMPWSLEHVMDKQEVAVIDNLPLEWELPGGIWPEPAQKAVVMPLTLRATSQKLFGIIICGISPRRSFDDDYFNFINFVKVQVAAALYTAHRAEQLVDLDKAKTAFFTNISHEFRTPLALMLGPLSDSLDSKSSPFNQEQRERQLLIQRNAQRLLKLVNNLLEFSRLEAGRVDASYSLTDLPKLTKEICNTFSSVLKEANIDFILEMNKLDSNVYIDKDMWEKIILNLLSNAFKFTLQGRKINNKQKKKEANMCADLT
jgi:signal transduction histidine kinase